MQSKKWMVVGLLALALMLGVGTGTASAQTQGGSDSTAAANFSINAIVFAQLAFNTAVGTGDQNMISLAYDVFFLAYYGQVSILGAGADGRTPFFSINEFDQSAPSYSIPSPVGGPYTAWVLDFVTGGGFEFACWNLALNLFTQTGDIFTFYTYLFARQSDAAVISALDNGD
jgi:hypothetical protein